MRTCSSLTKSDCLQALDYKMDKIIVKNARYQCNVGVSVEERSVKQDILVELVLFCDIKKAARSDSISDTFSYSQVNKRIKEITQNSYKLLETIAEKIAKAILTEFAVKKVLVRVKKPAALKNAAFAAVEIERNA